MQMPQLPSSRTSPGVAARDEGPPPEYLAATLVHERELYDAAFVEARRRLEELEADPETDELTLAMARHEVFLRKHSVVEALTS